MGASPAARNFFCLLGGLNVDARSRNTKSDTSISAPQSSGFGISPGLHMYVKGTWRRDVAPGAHRVETGSRPSGFTRKSLTRSPSPCHTIISTRGYDMKFV